MIGLVLAAAVATGGANAGDEGAVRAAEDQWSAAFVGGDTGYLDRLLTDDYVSVGTNGAAHPKAAIIGFATKFAAAHPGTKATPMPPSSTIQIDGDVALVRHTSASDVSVDVFQKREGRWRAWYSQHTAVKPPA